MGDLEKAFQQAVALAVRPEEEFLELGRCLALLNAQRGVLKRFLEASGMGSRKAYYLIDVAEVIGPLQLPEDRLKKMGWTKVQLIGEHIRKHNKGGGKPITRADARKLLKQAERLTTQQLKVQIQDQQSAPKSRCLVLYFDPDQYQLLEQALLAHGARRSSRGLADKELALISMVEQLGLGSQSGPEAAGESRRRSPRSRK